MPAVLTEHDQWVDLSGKPYVGGKVYYGVQGADPTVSPITIYSDRELTTIIANPQILDDFGRTTNKVWVAGRYSIRQDDLNDVQQYQELDNGETADKGITVLENVSGGNTIVATAASTITAYEDLEQYTFRTASVNTAAVTLNIDTVGAKSIVKNHDQAVLPGEFEADQNIVVSYNLTDDVFEWTNQNNKVIDFYTGANVATATQPDIWVTGGNTFHFTGTTTVVDLANAPNIGARRVGIADGAFTLTHGSGITLEGSANIEIAVGDRIEFLADALDAFSAWVTRADGTPVAGAATQTQQEAATSNVAFVTPLNQKWHPSAAKAAVNFSATGGTVVVNTTYNVTSVTDNGVGDFTVNFTTAFSSADYFASGISGDTGGNSSVVTINSFAAAPTASALRITTLNQSGTAADDDHINVICFGDQ